jgi:hypothetical protein
MFYPKGQSAQPEMFWGTYHTEPDPKIDPGDASLLVENMNYTRLVLR